MTGAQVGRTHRNQINGIRLSNPDAFGPSKEPPGVLGWARTTDRPIIIRELCQLSYKNMYCNLIGFHI